MSKFYVIATPIGNMGDITFRAIETLKNVDLILCEDTRETKKILQKYEISTPTLSYHSRSGFSKIEKIFDLLKDDKNIALVTDAGTPGISDPGTVLVEKIRGRFMNTVDIVPVPGPSAVISALSASGLPTHEFTFLGFLPHKKGRETIFREIQDSNRTTVFYESPHRILKTLESLKKFCPDKKVCIARELTKIYEEFKIGSAEEVLEYFQPKADQPRAENKVRGEFTVIVSS